MGLAQNFSLRAIARLLERPPSTISREVKRNSSAGASYQARNAQLIRNHRRIPCRPKKKLKLGSDLFDLVIYLLRQKFSPQQIGGRLRNMKLPGYEELYNTVALILNKQPLQLSIVIIYTPIRDDKAKHYQKSLKIKNH